MQRINSQGNQNNRFVDGDPTQTIDGTIINSDWLNSVQEELVNILSTNGISLNEATDSQIAELLNRRFLQAERKTLNNRILIQSSIIYNDLAEMRTAHSIPEHVNSFLAILYGGGGGGRGVPSAGTDSYIGSSGRNGMVYVDLLIPNQTSIIAFFIGMGGGAVSNISTLPLPNNAIGIFGRTRISFTNESSTSVDSISLGGLPGLTFSMNSVAQEALIQAYDYSNQLQKYGQGGNGGYHIYNSATDIQTLAAENGSNGAIELFYTT